MVTKKIYMTCDSPLTVNRYREQVSHERLNEMDSHHIRFPFLVTDFRGQYDASLANRAYVIEIDERGEAEIRRLS